MVYQSSLLQACHSCYNPEVALQYAVNVQMVTRSVHLAMMDVFPPSKLKTSKHQVNAIRPG
ncbi:hypothetical protein T4E_7218 [Trichinella pseudospiralis]|uniref:Uncharacterized protein n=1 Tax=Trichinella pseudospiralis TaxID=6337 RepID=A0A0V0Y7J1_TRIPS|nr:hypothetical protein T4E_7218 [Trichinella pseudospiralis]KRY93402.1 hypothetical protein T4D_2685 [Trichinella pseudospiralis]